MAHIVMTSDQGSWRCSVHSVFLFTFVGKELGRNSLLAQYVTDRDMPRDFERASCG